MSSLTFSFARSTAASRTSVVSRPVDLVAPQVVSFPIRIVVLGPSLVVRSIAYDPSDLSSSSSSIGTVLTID